MVGGMLPSNGEGIKDSATYLTCYQIEDVRGQPRFEKRDVVVRNQFGDETLAVAKAKVLCVPSHDPNYEQVHDLTDLPPRLLDEIEHFFDVYKMLEPEKNSTTRGYEGRDAAYGEIEASRLRFQSSA